MPATLYNAPLAHELYPLNDFPVPAPLSPYSEGVSPSLPSSAWCKLVPHSDLDMSSPLHPGQSPLQDQYPQDPYLSGPSDQDELEFQASAIRITPAAGSPNHSSSSPNDGMESRRPSIQSLGYLAPQSGGYSDPVSTRASPSQQGAFLAPSDINLTSGPGWQHGSATAFGAAAPTTSAQQSWSSSFKEDTSSWVGHRRFMPSVYTEGGTPM